MTRVSRVSNAATKEAPATVRPPGFVDRPLMRDPAFWGITATQFLGAFNDNLFKQLLLLSFVAVPLGIEGGDVDVQGLGAFAFSIPFILFSGFAGFLSDRTSKRTIIIASKLAEVGIMALGMIGWIWFKWSGFDPPLVGFFLLVLFAMGGQSAFFGPGKYGVLPELFRHRDLPKANSLILMTTFLAIIVGSAFAGFFKDASEGRVVTGWLKAFLEDRIWLASLAAIGIALLGTWTATWIRRTRPVAPGLKFRWQTVAIPAEVRTGMREDRVLRRTAIATGLFWMAAALVQLIVNLVGKNQMLLNDTSTSLMVAGVSIGIVAGSALTSPILRGEANLTYARFAGWMIVACLLLLAVPGFSDTHWLGYHGTVGTLIVLGGFTALFSIPLQVVLQERPSPALKGRVIATQNLLNWIGITLSTIVYWFAGEVIDRLGVSESWIYLAPAAIVTMMLCLTFPSAAPVGPRAGHGPRSDGKWRRWRREREFRRRRSQHL